MRCGCGPFIIRECARRARNIIGKLTNRGEKLRGYSIKVLFAAFKAITSPTFDNVLEVDQSVAIQESEHVAKLTKVILTPDVNKSRELLCSSI
jgi:hypothetical protein